MSKRNLFYSSSMYSLAQAEQANRMHNVNREKTRLLNEILSKHGRAIITSDGKVKAP